MLYQDNKKRGFLLIGILLIFAINLVVAQPPFQQSPDVGIIIETPLIEFHELNTEFDFHLHAHNFTTGLILRNDTIDLCTIHLYNSSGNGEHILQNNLTFDSNGFDWEIMIGAGNFSSIGLYDVLFYCEVPGEIGGFFEYGFEVNFNGELDETNKGLILIGQGGFMFLLFLVGRVFKKEKWKLKMFFDISALLIGVIILNTIKIIYTGTIEISTMGNLGVIIGITIISFMIAYFLVLMTIEILQKFKKNKNQKWSMDDYAK